MEQILHIKSFGAKLRVKDGLLEITTPDLSGAGNHTVHSFPAHQVTTILVNRQTSVSTDAVLLANDHDVDVFFVGDFDLAEAFVAPLNAPPAIRLWQRQLSLLDTPFGLSIARHWLALKIERKIEWLGKIKNYRSGEGVHLIEQTLHFLRDLYTRLKHFPLHRVPEAADSLRGMEGAGNRQYLDTLARLLPDALRFQGRSRQPAIDLFNAALNYAYGYLYRWVEGALWESGLHPYIGYLHTNERKQKSLVFDMVEAFRPWADKVVFSLCSRKEVGRQHTQVHNGGLWLNKEGCDLVGEALTDRFDQRDLLYHGRRWSLRQGIGLEARRLRALLRQPANPLQQAEWHALDQSCANEENGQPCAVCYEKVLI